MKKLLAVVMGVVVLAIGGYADTIIVDQINGPYFTIQAGIDAAENGDIVLVADGTYTGTGNKNLDFLGKAIEVISENGPENCIIDCEDDGRGFIFQSGEYPNSILDGLTIMNGYISSNGGGGIRCYNSYPSIKNCNIIGNISTGTAGGGIICWYNSHAIISNCKIINNNESGICCDMSSPTITNCVISGNIGGNGGGIICRASSDPIISNCTITENIANLQGGGISISGGNALITNCTISGNTATNGGGIYSQGSEFVMSNSILSDNNGQYGIHFAASQDATVNFCDFHNNENGNFTGNMPMFIGYITTTNPNGTPCDQYYNIFLDPLFTPGPDGDYYLSQPEGGQIPPTSPCVDAGDALVPPNWGTTCTNQGYDIGIIDMGYHYPHLEGFPLPVEMTLFTATGGDSKVIIRWVTASEWNNSHFNLYRSYAENGGFQNIAQIEGHGTTSEENEYRYEDCQVVNSITYYYRISDVDINGVEEFYEATVSATPGGGGLGIVADGYELKQNSPNQFNAGTRIDYTVFEPGLVRLVVYDVLGKEIAVLVNEMQENNGYSVVFNAENLSSGIYFYALGVNGYKEVKKMVLVR